MKNEKKSLVLLCFTALSKIIGLYLAIVFAKLFGADKITDAYYSAVTVPNLINGSITVASLTLFIPLFVEIREKKGINDADLFASNVLNSYVIFNFILSFLVILFAPILSYIVAPGLSADVRTINVSFIRLLSISFPYTIGTQVLINISNSYGKFIIHTVLNLCNNILTIGVLLLVGKTFGLKSYPIISTIVWIINLILQFIATSKHFNYKLYINLKDENLIKMMTLAIPVILSSASEQINITVDNILGTILKDGSVTYLNYSNKVYTSISSVFSILLVTIYYPRLSKAYIKDKEGFKKEIVNYINLILFIIIPFVSILYINGYDIIRLIYGRGNISNAGLYIINITLMGYSIGLLFFVLKDLSTKMFYIFNNTKTPMLISGGSFFINTISSIILIKKYGVLGISLGTSISSIFALSIQVYIIKKTYMHKASIKDFVDLKIIPIIFLSSFVSYFLFTIINSRLNVMFSSQIIKILFNVCIQFALYIIIFLLITLITNVIERKDIKCQ